MAHFCRPHAAGASERNSFPQTDARDAGMLRTGWNDLGTGRATGSSMVGARRTRRYVEAARALAGRILLYWRAGRDLNCVGVRGTTTQRTFARPTATGINLTTGTITSDFVVPGMWSGRLLPFDEREPERSRPL